MSSHEPSPQDPDGRDEHLAAALSDLEVPDHGPTFWADVDHRLQGESTVPQPERSATDAGPDSTPAQSTRPAAPAAEAVSLDEQRARRERRRGGRMSRSVGAAAAVVALVLAVAGAVTITRQDDNGTDIRAADPPVQTTSTGPAAAGAPAEFSATYDGIEGLDGPDGCCSQWRLTVARDGSYRWTSTDGAGDVAYNAATGMHWQVLSYGPGVSKERPNYIITARVPAGGPDQRVSRPDPLGPIADFVTALARAGDPRITTGNVAGRATWHYDGPTVQDRLGGDGAPNHAVADVDQASGALLHLTRRVDNLVVTRFTASDVTTSDQVDRTKFSIEVPPGAETTQVDLGFEPTSLEEAGAGPPYELLVPQRVPAGFALESVAVDRDVPSPTGPEGMNPPATHVVAMTWSNGAFRFTVTLRPKGGGPWDDPFGGEGMVPDAEQVSLPLAGRAPLEGKVIVDAPLWPHLWGITDDIVVTVSGDLSRAELEQVAGSLQPR